MVKNSRLSVLVTGARAPVALHLARLLYGAGHRVTLVDHLRHPVAAATSLDIPYRRIPSFTADAQGAGAALDKIMAVRAVDLVIPTCEEVLHLAAHWARHAPQAALFAPDLARLVQVHDKYRFIRLCDDIGLPVPQTRLLQSRADLLAETQGARSHVFKPVWSRFGSKVLIRPSPDALRRIHPTSQVPWVAQDHVSGTEICAYAVARGGQITALSAYRGLVRAGPGAAVAFAPVDAEIVRPFAARVTEATGWTGQISFDLIQQADGQVLPLECNPRATSGLHFFSDPAAFCAAVLGQGGEVRSDVTAPQAVRLALWVYGMRLLVRRPGREVFLDALRRSQDVLDWPGDRVGRRAQLRAVAEIAMIAARHGISLDAASTRDIAWNGPPEA